MIEAIIEDLYGNEHVFDFLAYRESHYSDKDDFVGFNYQTFRDSGWVDGKPYSVGWFDKYQRRYHESISVSLPIPFKGNPSQQAFLEPKVKSYIEYLKENAKTGFTNVVEDDFDKVIELVKQLLRNIDSDYLKKLTDDTCKWNNYLSVKRRIKQYKAKNKNSIYPGGSDFCPLNSFIPNSPPAGFIYAGDERFHQFILKQGEQNVAFSNH